MSSGRGSWGEVVTEQCYDTFLILFLNSFSTSFPTLTTNHISTPSLSLSRLSYPGQAETNEVVKNDHPTTMTGHEPSTEPDGEDAFSREQWGGDGGGSIDLHVSVCVWL